MTAPHEWFGSGPDRDCDGCGLSYDEHRFQRESVTAQPWPAEARKAAIEAHAAARNVPFPNAKDERAVDAVLDALADHVVPRQAVLDLANEWDMYPNEAAPPYRPLDAHRCAAELRDLTNRKATP